MGGQASRSPTQTSSLRPGRTTARPLPCDAGVSAGGTRSLPPSPAQDSAARVQSQLCRRPTGLCMPAHAQHTRVSQGSPTVSHCPAACRLCRLSPGARTQPPLPCGPWPVPSPLGPSRASASRCKACTTPASPWCHTPARREDTALPQASWPHRTGRCCGLTPLQDFKAAQGHGQSWPLGGMASAEPGLSLSSVRSPGG